MLGLVANRWAPFLVTDALMQNLPDQAAEAMGHHSDRLMGPQARHLAMIEDREDACLVLDRSVGGLIKKAPPMTITLRGSVAAAYPRRLVVAGAGAHPGGEVFLGGKGCCPGAHCGHDWLRRIHPQTRHLRQPLDLVLMGAEQLGHLLVESAHRLFEEFQLLQRFEWPCAPRGRSRQGIHGEPPVSPPAVERLVRMQFTGSAGRTLRANAAASPQGNRTDRQRPHLSDGFGEPGADVFRCFVAHVRMLFYMRPDSLQANFFSILADSSAPGTCQITIGR